MTTLQELIRVVESIQKTHHISTKKRKTKIVDRLLGKYKGVVPPGKTSTEYIRELRNSCYGKFK